MAEVAERKFTSVIPEQLFRQLKAEAALRGVKIQDVVTVAIQKEVTPASSGGVTA